MTLVYIAHPYSAPGKKARLKNVEKTMDAAIQLYYHGFAFICPNLMHYLDERATRIGKPLNWLDFMVLDLCQLARCDALLFLGSSPGTETELKFARQRNIPVFYSIEELILRNNQNNGTVIADNNGDKEQLVTDIVSEG
jgi:hypothetical protein